MAVARAAAVAPPCESHAPRAASVRSPAVVNIFDIVTHRADEVDGDVNERRSLSDQRMPRLEPRHALAWPPRAAACAVATGGAQINVIGIDDIDDIDDGE